MEVIILECEKPTTNNIQEKVSSQQSLSTFNIYMRGLPKRRCVRCKPNVQIKKI